MFGMEDLQIIRPGKWQTETLFLIFSLAHFQVRQGAKQQQEVMHCVAVGSLWAHSRSCDGDTIPCHHVLLFHSGKLIYFVFHMLHLPLPPTPVEQKQSPVVLTAAPQLCGRFWRCGSSSFVVMESHVGEIWCYRATQFGCAEQRCLCYCISDVWNHLDSHVR